MNYLSQLIWGQTPEPQNDYQLEKSTLQLKINNSYFTVPENVPPSMKLIDFIRDYVLNKGTKFMCREAGCGACIVAVKKYNPAKKKYEIFAINSCIVPIFLCSSWSIITVEGIGNSKHGLNKIQSTLANFSGTQCGYCTPGMVMNMFSLMNSKKHLTMEEIEDSFGGNVCRCTGYRPILDAFKSLASDASEDLKKVCVDMEDMMKESKLCPKTNNICTGVCLGEESDLPPLNKSFLIDLPGEAKWIRVETLLEVYKIFQNMRNDVKYMLVAGHTSHGVYRIHDIDVYIDISGVEELHNYSVNDRNLTIGANVSLNLFMDILEKTATDNPRQFSYLHRLVAHIDLVANVPVRNIGTIAGNLSIKHAHPEFPSDIFTILETSRAVLTIGGDDGVTDEYSLVSFLSLDMKKRVILNIQLPAHDDESYKFTSFKIMQRAQNTPAYVNAGFLFKVNRENKYAVQETPSIVFGGINSQFVHAEKTEEYLSGKELLNKSTIQEACRILSNELQPNNDPLAHSSEYRRSLAVNLLYKSILGILSPDLDAKYKSGGVLIKRPLSSGKQDYQLNKSFWPVGRPIPKLEAFLQCTGEAEYVNDLPTLPNELYGAVVLSKAGPAKLDSVDISDIKNETGFVAFLSAKDIPGKNTFVEGYGKEEEELFVSKDIRYSGQVIGVVVATNQQIANTLAAKVVVNVSGERKAVLDLQKIVESGDKSRIIQKAEKPAEKKKDDIKYRIEGSFKIGGQYHYTMETQTCLCVPTEDGMDVYSSTQWATLVQQNICVILNTSMNRVNVTVRRCGGAYGAKLGRSTLVAGVCAVAAHVQGKPVRMVMDLESNMRCIGKRFPMYAKYEVALNETGEIQSLTMQTYHDSGATMNDTVAEDTMLFGSKLYQTETWSWTGYDVRTDIAPNTFCRAPGSCEAVALLELIMEHIAHTTKLDPITVRMNNLTDNDRSTISSMLADLKLQSNLDNREKDVKDFNEKNRWKKRGLSVVFMNYPYSVPVKYHVVISVFAPDGTVSATHGGIEVGQGINTKVAQVIAYKFGIDLELVKIRSTNTCTAPNDDATGGSLASDGVSKAAIECCDILLKRLQPIKQQFPEITWPELIVKANNSKVDLLAESQYSPVPEPISYNIYGICATEVEVDLLTGQQQINRVDLLEDVGDSMSPYVDIGQVEGAFVMGLGYWLYEKLIYDKDTGDLLSNRSWSYTPPTARDIPVDFRVYFRRNAPNAEGVLRSKAVGEPPLCLSVSAVFAVRNALASSRKDAVNSDEWFDLSLPYTPENILLSSLTNYKQFDL